MDLLCGLVLLLDLYPLLWAWRSNRHTTLRGPLAWAFVAWAAWIGAAGGPVVGMGQEMRLVRYLALCLTGCAGVAVLGARRPGAGAWNFVVGGLLAVLLLPVLHGLGDPRPEAAHWIFLAIVVLVPLCNYLPTRRAATILLTAGCGLEMLSLAGTFPPHVHGAGMVLVSYAPLAALYGGSRRGTWFDHRWFSYRDRFGFVWGQRMREQFNRAAHNAGWPIVLHWGGLHVRDGQSLPPPEALVDMLNAVVKRFTDDVG